MSDPLPRFQGDRRIAHGLVVAVLFKASAVLGAIVLVWLTPVLQLLWVFGALLGYGRISLRDLGWRTDRLAIDLALGALGFAISAVALLGVAAASGDDPAAFVSYLGERTVSEQLLFLAIGVLAAFGEESIFRGYLQPAFIQRFGFGLGVFGVAILFALLHFKLRAPFLLGKLAIGLVLGMLRGRNRSLFAPGSAHALIWAVFGFY